MLSYDRKDFSRGKPIAMTVGEPIPIPKGSDPDVLTEELHARMAALLDETIARYPDKPPGAWWIPARLGGSAPTPEEAEAIEERVREEKAARAHQGRAAIRPEGARRPLLVGRDGRRQRRVDAVVTDARADAVPVEHLDHLVLDAHEREHDADVLAVLVRTPPGRRAR